jgi:tetratricopeptide (TPR) repeat protein
MRSLNRSLHASLWLVLLSSLIWALSSFALTSQDIPSADWSSPDAPAAANTVSPRPSQTKPQEDNPSSAASSAASPTNSENGNSVETENGSINPEAGESNGVSGWQPPAGPGQPPPALDVDGLTINPRMDEQSLDPEINKAVSPASAASLRLTESARELLRDGQIDEALRDLARAVSLDASNAFAYYYLGRAYLARKNYPQALTFFRHAALAFDARSDWAAEALTYQGLCDEELGKDMDAARAYKQALALSPNNFRARVGYGRLASVAGPPQDVDVPPPTEDLAAPPPSESEDLPAADEPPPPPP